MKYIKALFTLYIILSLSSSFSYSQTVEVQGFVPNRGQFSGKGVLGQFCGANDIFYLTDSGLSFDRIDVAATEDFFLYSDSGKHCVSVLGSGLISMDSIELYDSSDNALNYYLPHCKDGILDIRAYAKIVIKSILPGINWEIRYTPTSLLAFSHSFIQIDTSKPHSDIILQIRADRTLDTLIYDSVIFERYIGLIKNTIIELQDTLSINTYYGVFDLNSHLYYETSFENIRINRRNRPYDTIKPIKSVWNTDWHTHYNSGYSNYYVSYDTSVYYANQSFPNALNFVESATSNSRLANSATDNNGNYYIVGATILNAQERSAKDGLNYYTEAFISKFDKNSKLLWTTFYGSSLSDIATGIAINSKNDIYLSGYINLHPLKDDLQKMSVDLNYRPTLWKNDFPTKRHNNDSCFSDTVGSLFLLKLDTNGKREWATLIGKDYGEINNDAGQKRSYMIDCEFFTSAVSSKDDIYFSGTYRPSLFRSNANAGLPSIGIREQAMGLPTRGDANSNTWTMSDINNAAPDRFSSTNQWNVYPFILKLDSNDNLVWSTYFFSTQPIAGMVIDSKDNLYIGGNSIEDALPVKEKEGAFYNGNSFFKDGNLDLPILEMERRAYIAEFNKDNKLTWCTYLEDEVDKNSNTITVINDIDIGLYDNLLLTGYTTNTKFPLRQKVNAYFEDYPSTPTQNTFIMEFDNNSNLQWSTLYVLGPRNSYGFSRNSWGLDIESMLDGDIFLALSTSGSKRDIHYTNETDLYILEFDKYSKLKSENRMYISMANFGNKILDRDIIIDSFSFEKYDNYNDFKRLYNMPYSAISLKSTSQGRAYIAGEIRIEYESGNMGGDKYFGYDKTTFVTPGSFGANQSGFKPIQNASPSPIIDFDLLQSNNLITSKRLCDSIGTFTFPFKDSLLCVWNEINIPLSLDDTLNFSQHNFYWYKNNKEVKEGKDYTITDTGFYYFIAENVYEDCPDYHSDTVNIFYIPDQIDLNFREDTIPLCVGVDNYVIRAYNLKSTYLWSDSTTDSTYIVRYKGDSIAIIWCEVSNICGATDRDSVTVRFYPPYAYLGEDSVFCKGDILNFDASILNKSIPAVLEYRWILNGDTIDGTGANNELFTITEKDSGQLILHAIWPGSGCEVGIDTLNFSYYKYDYVGFYLPKDTSICFYEELRVDLIANKTSNIDTNTIYLCLNSKGDIISQKSIFTLKDTLIYYISATNHCSKQKDTLKLSYFNNFNIEILQPTDTAICQELFPTEIYGLTTEQIDGKCYWLSENKEDTIEIGPSRYINQDGTYPITLSDIYNCSQDYDIIVSLKEDCSPQIDMPNVFTPNSDGVNDFFKIISADNVKDFDIVIFNKAGAKVYEYKGLIENFAWNGCYKNSARDVPEGAYFFVILYKDVTNATRKQAGTITLLR